MRNQLTIKDFYDDDESELKFIKDKISDSIIWGTDWTTETIVQQLKNKNIDLNPKFQRRNAWSVVAKSKFIESIILGMPIPQIILAERKDRKGTYIVIDGKQRLLTILSFFSDEYDDEISPFKLKGLNILHELNGKGFKDLWTFKDFTNLLNNQTIRTSIIKNWGNEEFLYAVFLRLNTGSTQLSPQELRQALHPGKFIDYSDDFSSNSLPILSLFKLDKPDNRMRDVEIFIRYFTFKYYLGNYSGNLKEAFDHTVNDLNKKWDLKENQIVNDSKELENAILATQEIFGLKESFGRYADRGFNTSFNRAIFDIMVYYFSQPKIREAALLQKERIKEKFIELSESDYEFSSSLEHTTKSIPNTAIRFERWGAALKDVIDVNVVIPKLDIKKNRFVI